ncbi:HHE domain-containing protein [Coccidioides immitis RS]|uniref:HHE domain-containing protein n=4 Tax=Coccidioides immitis TaxID=5501 RepID=J3KE40_COCIM|nr:HHE domain-containing protein [Coccidioides immitis RS]KMP04895.1 HHE domain containing protein [Coccidioides immitis RMSCC 2394]KMU78090.1 HHE domain containing protein [Coccidioides immitis RMSCC 3703]KMU86397.1 HHE domain-containing protein [Coccidioides immitis H538.4]TPX21361.1 hypothetical protein DIZ76_015318 [Coccidioides immitis]EAS33708.3 HHE domain-containing protein [Coccidioides immitis RS]
MLKLPIGTTHNRALSSISRFTIFSRKYPFHRQFSASTATMGLSDSVKKDHRELEDYYNQIINATDDDTKIRYRNQFTWELARHSIGEELLVYPAFEKHLHLDGKKKADRDRQEHQVVKEQLKQFQNMEPTEPNFIPTIKSLMSNLSEHIKEEEAEDLPALEEALSTEESDELEKSFGRTKMFVPTRSHPSAPDKPPFETAIGLMTAPIDMIGDMFRKFPK